MKCQHGQMISKFCIFQKCQSKTSASCNYCLKKNHFHLGHSETLQLKDVQELLYSLGINHSRKNHLAPLRELIIHYFQALKAHISKSLQSVCKNMIDRISHSYLYDSNLLEKYKKLSSRQYGKISSNQLRQLHLFNLKNTQKKLQEQQQRCYIKQVNQIQSTMDPLKKVFQIYEEEVRPFDKSFSSDSFVFKKIMELSEKILVSYEQQVSKQAALNLHKNQDLRINLQQKINKLQIQNSEKPKLLSLAQYKNQKSKSTQSLKSKNNINFQLLNIKKTGQRKLSIALDGDKLNTSFFSRKSQNSDKNSTTPQNNEQEYQNMPMSKEINSPIQKIWRFKSRQNLSKGILKYKSKQKHQISQVPNQPQNQQFFIKINEPSKVEQIKNNKNNVNKDENLLNSQNFHWKQCNSVILDEPVEQTEQKVIINNKKIKLPPTNDHDFIKSFEKQEDIKKKIIKFQINPIKRQSLQQIQSPLYINKFRYQNNQKTNEKAQNLHNQTSPLFKKQYFDRPLNLRKNSSTQQANLTQNQLKSLALLLQSLKLPSQKALVYLRKSFQFCPQNLSTAQYMSYILLQQNHPKQCLQLCNYMINKIFTHTNNYNFSIHILNNKAAALNSLGRFSQTIQFLQKILQSIQKDTLYKNIADAYCALGITEKSIINYQKCISLNREYDEAFYNLAVCFYTQNHYEEALETVSEAIKINSEKDEYIELYRNTKLKLG